MTMMRLGSEREGSDATSKRGGPRRLAKRPTHVWRDAAAGGLSTVAGNVHGYERARTLPRLIAFDPGELKAPGPALDRSIVRRLTRAIRAERKRGLAGHWTYDVNRHVALRQALAAEADISRRSAAGRSCKFTPGA